MKSKQPPFEITHQIIDSVAQIAELVGRLTAVSSLPANPTLRRSNRIRTIHGSLAIEQNTLSLEQVTAVLGGKHVLAPPKDIAEVKNAYEIYEHLDELDPYSADDLLLAHGIMIIHTILDCPIMIGGQMSQYLPAYRSRLQWLVRDLCSPGDRVDFLAFCPSSGHSVCIGAATRLLYEFVKQL